MSTSTDGTESRAVIITGGGTGIGRATARAFADQGDRVLVVGRTRDTLESSAEGYPTIRPLALDITAPGAPELIVSTALREFGRIDILVNNAAIAAPRMLADIDPELTDGQLAVNLRAPILLTQHALGALTDTGGTVVNVSTAGSFGRRAWPSMSIYGASKVAMDFLTRTWAAELAPLGIRVTAVAPGVINTGMGERMGYTPDEYAHFLEDVRTRIPNGRVGRPEEIAWWIVQLAQPQASYATGTVLVVDGGASVV